MTGSVTLFPPSYGVVDGFVVHGREIVFERVPAIQIGLKFKEFVSLLCALVIHGSNEKAIADTSKANSVLLPWSDEFTPTLRTEQKPFVVFGMVIRIQQRVLQGRLGSRKGTGN